MKYLFRLINLTGIFLVLFSLGTAAAHQVIVTPGPAPIDGELLAGRYFSFAGRTGGEVSLNFPGGDRNPGKYHLAKAELHSFQIHSL